jgi:hypothetical protein
MRHPDEIRAKKVIRTRINTDEHGYRKSFVSPSAKKIIRGKDKGRILNIRIELGWHDKGQRQLEFGFRNEEFGRKDEKSDQGGRIEAAKLGSWEATEC